MKTNEIYPNVEEKVERWAYVELVLSIILGIMALIGGIGSGNGGLIVGGVVLAFQGYIIFTIMKLWIKTSLYVVRINNILESMRNEKTE